MDPHTRTHLVQRVQRYFLQRLGVRFHMVFNGFALVLGSDGSVRAEKS